MELNKTALRRVFENAERAAVEAAEKVVPVPMIVQQRANPLDDSSPVIREYAPVMGGVCGFAWIVFSPGNSKIANFAKQRYGKDGNGFSFERNETPLASRLGMGAIHKNYGGGVASWISAYGQSMTRKEAFANAYVRAFHDAGLDGIYAQSRMD